MASCSSESILDVIGNTPMKKLGTVYKGKGTLWGKMEFLNPSGSMKDRAARQVILDAYENGNLKPGQTVVEMTAGNMGAGLAIVCGAKGNPFIAVMPEGNDPVRRKILRSLGAEVRLVKPVDGEAGKVTGKDMKAAEEEACRLAEEKGGFFVNQFNNRSPFKAHYSTTGPEIWQALGPKIGGFVAAIGSGGTLLGTSAYLKEQKEDVITVGVEPENASMIRTGVVKSPLHIIQGTGLGIVPPLWQEEYCDRLIGIGDDECREMACRLSREEGCYVGYSAAANVLAAIKILEEKDDEEFHIVAILSDSGFKYSDL